MKNVNEKGYKQAIDKKKGWEAQSEKIYNKIYEK